MGRRRRGAREAAGATTDTPPELQGYMESEEFAANPIGIEFDPEVLLARYENGDPLEELLLQGSAGSPPAPRL